MTSAISVAGVTTGAMTCSFPGYNGQWFISQNVDGLESTADKYHNAEN